MEGGAPAGGTIEVAQFPAQNHKKPLEHWPATKVAGVGGKLVGIYI